jgi:peptide chain release factor 3
MRSKNLRKALEDLAQEGVSQLFKPMIGSNWLVGVVGQLQLDVLISRLESEYKVKAGFDAASYETACWVTSEDKAELQKFIERHRIQMAEDRDGFPVYLARNQWELNHTRDNFSKIVFHKTREQFF